MKTNTNLALITIDLAYAEQALVELINVQLRLTEVEEWVQTCSYHGELVTTLYRVDDAVMHLRRGVSEMRRIVRKNKRAALRKSVGGTRATNRAITGIG